MGVVYISQGPRLALVALAVVALVLIGLGVWVGVRLGSAWDRPMRLIQAALIGIALGLFTLSIAGQLHYGGSGATSRESGCAAWFEEAGLPSGRSGLPGDPGSLCRHDAIAAIGPALAVAFGIAVIGAGLTFAIHRSVLRRRRGVRRPRTRYVDT